MPCDSIITNRIEVDVLSKNPTLLATAVAHEFKGQLSAVVAGRFQFMVDGRLITVANGQASVRGASSQWLGQQMDRLKQAYSREAVKEAARRAGFTVRQQGDNVNLMTAERRTA